MQYCSLQHQTLLLSPVTSTAGYSFCFGSIPLFFLELFLPWSPVAYWAPTDLGSSSFSILSFCLFILFMGFSRQEYWSGLPFPSPMNHILSDISTMTHPSWVAPWTWLSFIELDKAVVRVIRLTSFLWLWFRCVCPLMPSSNTYRLTWVSLTLDEGYLLTAVPPDLECRVAPLGPPAPVVAPLGHRPWPWTWGSSSWLPPLTSDVGKLLLAAAPDLRRGEAPLGHASARSVTAGALLYNCTQADHKSCDPLPHMAF